MEPRCYVSPMASSVFLPSPRLFAYISDLSASGTISLSEEGIFKRICRFSRESLSYSGALGIREGCGLAVFFLGGAGAYVVLE
jgi:hypothetical protein